MTVQPTTETLAKIALPVGAIGMAVAVVQLSVPIALAALAFVMVGLAAAVTHVIERAVTNTDLEREQLLRAQEQANELFAKNLLTRSHLDEQSGWLRHRAEELEAELEQRAQQEREELLADLEDRRAAIKREGYFTALDHVKRGILTPGMPLPDGTGATVIQLPVQDLGSNPSAERGNPS